MTVPAAAEARATATSPSGWNSRWCPTGATITGSEMRVPMTVVASSGSAMPASIRGRNRIRASAAAVSRCQSWTLSRSAGTEGPIDELDGVEGRDMALQVGRDLDQAARVGGGDHVGVQRVDRGRLAPPEIARGVGLQQVVDAGRAAADLR